MQIFKSLTIDKNLLFSEVIIKFAKRHYSIHPKKIFNMKKFIFFLLSVASASMITASAVLMLPAPKLVSEDVQKDCVKIAWEFSSTDAPNPFYHVIVYKMHKATTDENFVLAKTNFDYIQSEGTMKKHEERGAIWDYIPDCPGWYAKWPLYMNGALGIDTQNNYTGADNDDIFGGAYLVSPDYDLTHVKNNMIKVEANLGREAASVTGGFCIWTFNTDTWDPSNVDYKPVPGHDHIYDDLDMEQFKHFSEACQANSYMSRTRVMFYGRGYSAFWINDFKVSVDMTPGDSIAYAAAVYRVDGKTNFTIDTSTDTDSDYVYGYEIRAIREDKREYPKKLMYMRFISPSLPMKIIGVNNPSSVQTIESEDKTATEEYYTLQGTKIDHPIKGEPIIVRKGSTAYKIIMH